MFLQVRGAARWVSHPLFLRLLTCGVWGGLKQCKSCPTAAALPERFNTHLEMWLATLKSPGGCRQLPQTIHLAPRNELTRAMLA